jgi:branched-subunit amino acid ABC-type transport system permease component
MKFGYDGSGFGEIASITGKYTALVVSSAAVSHLQFSATFGLPLPALFTALVGALLSLLFMDPLEGKQRRWLPATVLTFALVGAGATIFLQTFSFTEPYFKNVPAPMFALILGFTGHRLIPLLLVDGFGGIREALRAAIAKLRRTPNA